jgi:hypothetical protein
VRHGRGTAWGWLDVDVDAHGIDDPAERRALHDRALAIAQLASGRHGEYSGRIEVTLHAAVLDQLAALRTEVQS